MLNITLRNKKWVYAKREKNSDLGIWGILFLNFLTAAPAIRYLTVRMVPPCVRSDHGARKESIKTVDLLAGDKIILWA